MAISTRRGQSQEVGAGVAIGELPPRNVAWPGQVLAILAAGLILGSVLYMFDRKLLIVPVGVGAVLLCALIVVFGMRAQARGEFVDKAIEAVNPVLGARVPTRDLVRFARWEDGWVGVPSVVRLKYSAAARDSEPRFGQEIAEVLFRRLGIEFRVAEHNRRRCVMVFERTNREKDSPEVVRAKEVATALLGDSAKVSTEQEADGNVVAVEVQHDIGPKTALTGYRARIENVITTMLPGRWRARWDLEHDRVRFEVRPAMPKMILNTPPKDAGELTHRAYMQSSVVLATDEDSNPVSWIPSKMPHVLVVGGTGSGKTSLEHTILTQLAAMEWRVWVLDGKRIEFVGFRDWPNVELVASKVEDQVRMVHAAHELMEHRYSLIESGSATVADFEPLALIIDEYATFKKRVERWYREVKPKGAPTHAPVFDLIGDIARLGRSGKVHLTIGIQRPDVTFLDGEMRDNFASRFSLGRLSPQGAKMMWDSFAVGVIRTPQGRGIGLNEAGDTVEILAHYTPDPAKSDPDEQQAQTAIDDLRPPRTLHPRKMIESQQAQIDDTGKSDKLIEPDYYDFASARIINYDPERQDASYIPAPEPEEISDGGSDEETGQDEIDEFEGYGQPDSVQASDLVEGDLVLVDESLDMWGVVETAEPDIVDDESIAIDYRDIQGGEPSTISIPADDALMARHPDSSE